MRSQGCGPDPIGFVSLWKEIPECSLSLFPPPHVRLHVLLLQVCPAFYDPMDYNPPSYHASKKGQELWSWSPGSGSVKKMDAIWVTQSAVFCCGCNGWLITFQKTDKSTSFQSTSFRDRRVGLFRKRSGERSRGRDLSGKAGHGWVLQLGLMMVVVGFLEQWEAAEGAGYLEEIEVAKRGGTVDNFIPSSWFCSWIIWAGGTE